MSEDREKQLGKSRAHCQAIDDQNIAQAVEWFRETMKACPELLLVMAEYLNRPVEGGDPPLSTGQLELFRRFASIGFYHVTYLAHDEERRRGIPT